MKSHKYNVTVTHVEDKDGQPVDGATISFATANHDELFQIVRRMQGAGMFSDDEAAAFAIGLKLFSETMLMHKDSELFTELKPHFMAFMKHLKVTLKND